MCCRRLPVPISRIVYRYLYDTVLEQLTASYGKTLRLNRMPVMCERIRNDTTCDTTFDSKGKIFECIFSSATSTTYIF